jgi:hypothetical protein
MSTVVVRPSSAHRLARDLLTEPALSPARRDDPRDPERQADDQPDGKDDAEMSSRTGERRPDLGRPGLGDRAGEDGVEVEAHRSDRGNGQDEQPGAPAIRAVELVSFEEMELEIEQRGPDPDRRQHLDQRQPPVEEQ